MTDTYTCDQRLAFSPVTCSRGRRVFEVAGAELTNLSDQWYDGTRRRGAGLRSVRDMTDLMLFALLGLGAGALIALLAIGVVGEYMASGVVNFAHGAVAMFCAYCYTSLRATGELVLPVVVLPHRIPLAGGGLQTAPAIAITLVYARRASVPGCTWPSSAGCVTPPRSPRSSRRSA